MSRQQSTIAENSLHFLVHCFEFSLNRKKGDKLRTDCDGVQNSLNCLRLEGVGKKMI